MFLADFKKCDSIVTELEKVLFIEECTLPIQKYTLVSNGNNYLPILINDHPNK